MKIDYSLEIKGEKVTHKPNIEILGPILKSDKRIFEIKVENGYGKTFLLNLIAFSLRGFELKSNEILESLKMRVNQYNNRSSYDLNFNIEYSLPDGRVLKSVKKEDRFITSIWKNGSEGPPVNSNQLHKDITVLYDVPSDPSERLKGVIKNVTTWNKTYLERSQGFREYLQNLERDFGDAIDYAKISDYKKNILSLDQDIKNIQPKVEDNRSIKKKLEVLKLLHRLETNRKRKLVLEKDELKCIKKLKKTPRPQSYSSRNDKELDNLQRFLSNEKETFKNAVLSLIELIEDDSELKEGIYESKSQSKHYQRIRESEFSKIIHSDEPLVMRDKLIDSVEKFSAGLLAHIDDISTSDKAMINKHLTQVVDSLKRMLDYGLEDFLTEILNKDALITLELVEQKLTEYNVKSYSSQIRLLRTIPVDLKKPLSEGFRLRTKIKKENDKKGNGDEIIKYNNLKSELEDVKLKIKNSEREFNDIEKKIAGFSTSYSGLEDFLTVSSHIKTLKSDKSTSIYTEDLDKGIKKIENEFSIINLKKQKLSGNKLSQESLLAIEEDKKEEQFNEDEKAKISKMSHFLKIAETNLYHFNKNGLSENPKVESDEDKEYFKIMGSIIAHSMNNRILRQSGEFIGLEYYDLLNREFHCENKIIIKKDDISTGLASANYLMQRIENVQGKYVVILLDEIGNMSQDSINQVLKSIKKLEKENRLILALLAQPKLTGIEILQY
jgi:hypothetical protein